MQNANIKNEIERKFLIKKVVFIQEDKNLFSSWNKLKQKIDSREGGKIFLHTREVWWCSLGVNVGGEINGKNELYERPCLMLNVYNKDMALVLPITSIEKKDKFHYEIILDNGKKVYVKLTQVRVISTKRVIRKISTLNKEDFKNIKEKMRDYV